MCGLFGVAAPRAYPAAERGMLGQRVRALGRAAQERGTDGAGVAMLTSTTAAPAQQPPRTSTGAAAHVEIAGWTIMRTTGAFRRLSAAKIDRHARRASIILGHTRWATQGGLTRHNTSPMLVGTVLGTHNGDVDTASLRPYSTLDPEGVTDSAVLFDALSDGHAFGSLEHDVVPVLSHAVGRIAAVWADLTQPGHVWLARGALSPLYYATDDHGAAWWASNPAWLRDLKRQHAVHFDHIYGLDEGRLFAWRVEEQDVRVMRCLGFQTHARMRDRRVADVAAWRGFTAADRAADQRRLRHRIVDRSRNLPSGHLVLNDGALI